MTAVLLWLKSKLFGSSSSILIVVLVAIVAIIVLPNLDAIKEKLGIETRASLKVKVEAQKEVIDDLESSNTNLVESIETIEQINAVKEKAVEQHIEVKEEVKEEVKKIVKAKTIKVKAIKASTASQAQQHQQISEVQINSIWDSYCSFNNHASCGVTS